MRVYCAPGRWLLATAMLCGSGCALRVGGSEHYFGPVLFRYAEPPAGRAYVSQVRSIGLLGEIGTQWGAALGAVDRVAAAPATGACAPAGITPQPWRWHRYGLPDATPRPGVWHLSPFYLRGDGVPPPCFTRRATYGVAATAGPELNAFSIGITTRTHTRPPADAVTLLRFDDARPLNASLVVWPADPAGGLPIATILKEVDMKEVSP